MCHHVNSHQSGKPRGGTCALAGSQSAVLLAAASLLHKIPILLSTSVHYSLSCSCVLCFSVYSLLQCNIQSMEENYSMNETDKFIPKQGDLRTLW